MRGGDISRGGLVRGAVPRSCARVDLTGRAQSREARHLADRGRRPVRSRESQSLMKIVVAMERVQQNALEAYGCSPLSLASIQALERTLEEEFIECGGTWDGVERAMRDAMVAQTTEARRRAEAAGAHTRGNSRRRG